MPRRVATRPRSLRALTLSSVICLMGWLGSYGTVPTHSERAAEAAHTSSVNSGGDANWGDSGTARSDSTSLASRAYDKLPLSFELNEGQAHQQAKFVARGHGYGLFLTRTEAVLALYAKGDARSKHSAQRKAIGPELPAPAAMLTMKLGGANNDPEIIGLDALPGRVNYITGKNPAGWRTGIPTFSRVRYADVYPGIDLVYYGNQRQLEYDFILAPGADPQRIKLHFEGARHVEITDGGDLLLTVAGREVRLRRPVLYQTGEGGRREEITGGYAMKGSSEVGFSVGKFDRRRALVIDPVLVYSTYLGGSLSDTARDIAVDLEGNAYVTGFTWSVNFPITPGAYQKTVRGQADAFVTKLNAAGNAVVYSTFFGGTADSGAFIPGPSPGHDEANAIAVDAAGSAVVAGTTTSTKDFPVTPGAYQAAFGGGTTEDAFVLKLSPSGGELMYSTRLGGDDSDRANGVSLDSAGNAYVIGTTESDNFPATFGAVGSSPTAVYVSKLNPAGTALVYSAVLGAGIGEAVAVDDAGSAYVTGLSTTDNFPVTPGAFQTVAPGGFAFGFSNVFVTKLDAAGAGLTYSTFLGGRDGEWGYAIDVDAAGSAYVTGYTDSRDFPVTPGAFQTTKNSSTSNFATDAFVTKLNANGSALVYSTFLGGPGSDREEYGRTVKVNSSGEAYVFGDTSSNTFPVTAGAHQATLNGFVDAFLVKLNAAGGALLYSTYVGGVDQELAGGAALGPGGSVYVTGMTQSTNFPVTPGAFRTYPSGHQFDFGSFVAKFGETSPAGFRIGGRLTDGGGNGLGAVAVALAGPLQGTQWTDPDGNYSFGGLPPGGSYTVTPSSPYYDFSPQSRGFDNLTADQTADFAGAVRRFRIAGAVKDNAGSPLAGVTLTLGGAQSATTQTDTAGHYAFENLSAVGTYTVTPSKANYFFTPFRQSFTNLDADRTADFAGTLAYSVRGQVLDSEGRPLVQFLIKVTATNYLRTVRTDNDGNYLVSFLPAGGSYTVTPDNQDFTFSPPSQTFENLSDHQTANFTGTFRFGDIRGRVTDASGNGVGGAKVVLSGPQPSSYTTFNDGNYWFSGLLKGGAYTVTATRPGYNISPPSHNITVTGNHTANFTATLNQLKPFTAGNLLVTAGNLLGEYTPAGAMVQAVLVPSPVDPSKLDGHFLGDVVLDKNGEAEIFSGVSAASYLTGYSFTEGGWRRHTYPGWNPWVGSNEFEGIATFGDYVYVTDKLTNDHGLPVQTQGILRINLNDYAAQRFASDLTFRDLTMGKDGLLYAIEGGTSGSQIYVYNPVSMELVRKVSLRDLQNFSQNVHGIAVNSAGEIYAIAFQLGRYGSDGKMVKSVQIEGNLSDVEVSDAGQVAVATHGTLTLLDESLNVIGSFRPETGARHVAFTNAVLPRAASVKFSTGSYDVAEGAGSAILTVVRTGDMSSPLSVGYVTSDGSASDRSDYLPARGTLSFAPGEESKTFTVIITDDAYAEGPETVAITLVAPVGAPLGSPSSATLTINSDEASDGPNPVRDATFDAAFFVRQHYADFLNREPDASGLNFWSNQITECGANAGCLQIRKINVSAAFFLSTEFQETGFYAYRVFAVAFGRSRIGGTAPMTLQEFLPETQQLSRGVVVGQPGWEEQLEANKAAYFGRLALSEQYRAKYADMGHPVVFVQTLNQNVGGVLSRGREDALIQDLSNGSKTQLQVLRAIAEDPDLVRQEKNRAFVLMQYFGYLRRNPYDAPELNLDFGGYNFWLQKLNNHGGNFVAAEMVKAFITSGEYQQRFGP